MSLPIFDPHFWRKRHAKNRGNRHLSIYHTTLDNWCEIEAEHRRILASTIKPNDNILDAGCAWGRLLDLLPPTWRGGYLGIDLSPDFIQIARSEHPRHEFMIGDLRNIDLSGRQFDWCIGISLRRMIIENTSQEVWRDIESKLRPYCTQIMMLEYKGLNYFANGARHDLQH